MREEIKLIGQFLKLQGALFRRSGALFLGWIGVLKRMLSRLMYKQRGRFSQTFVSVSMAVLAFGTIGFSGELEAIINKRESGEGAGSNYLLVADGRGGGGDPDFRFTKREVTEYRVVEGDTVGGIAQKFGVTVDTIVWENNLKSVDAIKARQILRILPIIGVRHRVKRGESIYSIAKHYSVDAQNIVDYPFNSFSNDETFAINAGQELTVPDAIKPKEIIIDTGRYIARSVAPIPGVVGEGNFMWPTSGRITQRFSWYHQAVDIASKDGPNILAAQSGSVVTAGWGGGGYGIFVVIDHGNGYQTLYGHMLNNSLVVTSGQKVSQGQKLGVMGSTGRSTGPHLHFEIKTAKGKLDPLSVLK